MLVHKNSVYIAEPSSLLPSRTTQIIRLGQAALTVIKPDSSCQSAYCSDTEIKLDAEINNLALVAV